MIYLKNNRGFTLIEVVASIVIIAIVLVSFAQFFTQTNKTANHNNERLVVINLADAALAKLRASTFTKNTSYTNLNQYFDSSTKSINLNGKEYTVTYQGKQNTKQDSNLYYGEKDLNLISVIVTVTSPNGTKSSTEGYVTIE